MQALDEMDLSWIPTPAILVRRNGSIASANAQVEQLLNYGPGELQGRAFEELVESDRWSESQRHLEAAFQDHRTHGPAMFRESQAVTRDGREIPVEIGIAAASAEPAAVVEIRDMTATAGTLAKLRESERRLKIGLTHTTNLIQYVDIDRDYLGWYGDLDTLLGYAPGEFPHTLSGWFELIHPDDVDRVQKEFDRFLDEEASGWRFHYRLRAKDGSHRYILDRGTFTGYLEGRPNEGIGGIVDETEHVVAREALMEALAGVEEQSAFNELVLDSMLESVAVLDPQGQIIAVNHAWRAFAGGDGDSDDTTGRRGVGADYLEVCRQAAQDVEAAREAFDGIRSVLDGDSVSFTLQYECHTPSQRRWRSMSVIPLKRGKGALVVHSDVTDLIQSQRELEDALSRLAEMKDRLQAESTYLQSEIASSHGFDEIVGASDALAATLAKIESVAETDATVLLLGETGTGKELLARAIHKRSKRKGRPLIKVDCGTLPAGLIESELFGHVKGAFTGAHEQKAGRFELAHKGTVFLDEIGDLPLDLQTKLLQVLEDGTFRRVGGKSDQTVDVRIIAATNRDLRVEARERRFRSDLFFRLDVFPIEAPPLRERREDIPGLVSFFATRYAKTIGKPVQRVAQRSLDALVAYDWPGNVRELRNVIERSVILSTGDTLTVDTALVGGTKPAPDAGAFLKHDLEAIERARIIGALEESHWTIKGEGNAASRLGVTPSGLRSRMKKLRIARPA